MKNDHDISQDLAVYTPPQPQYYMFKGNKKKVTQMNKTIMLKTKRLRQKEINSLRYDNNGIHSQQQTEGLNWQGSIPGRIEQVKSQMLTSFHRRAHSQSQINKSNNLQRLQKLHRNYSSDKDSLMITTSRMQNSSRQSRNAHAKQEVPRFYSKNLQLKMNEYLNMVVAKSSQDHKEQLKKIKDKQTQHDSKLINRDVRLSYRNKFLRQLKGRSSSLAKKDDIHRSFNHEKDPNESHNAMGHHNFLIQNGSQLINLATQMLSKSINIRQNQRQNRHAVESVRNTKLR